MSSRGNDTAVNPVQKSLIELFDEERQARGLSLRNVSVQIGVSFSTLARLVRGIGDPDPNTKVRIVNWLGPKASKTDVAFDDVALVHFRASKGIEPEAVSSLLKIAKHVLSSESGIDEFSEFDEEVSSDDYSEDPKVLRSKNELESISQALRNKLKLDEFQQFNPFEMKIKNIDIVSISQMTILSDSVSNLVNRYCDSWSAMSIPLDNYGIRWSVLLNDYHSETRRKVTFLEEFWHIHLGHKLTKICKVADSYGRTFESHEEDEAFYLAAATLLPRKAIRFYIDEKLPAAQIADRFGVSRGLVEFRIKRLGFWPDYIGREISL